MKSIDFVIIGAQKCGTTSLAAWLSSHPRVAFCRHKEPHFFSQHDDWEASLNQYHGLYDNWDPCLIRGEASTSYTFRDEFPEVAGRLHKYNPELKLIYIVREPIGRIVSHYHHRKLRNRVELPIDEEVFRDKSYIARTRYSYQLEPYLELFDVSNIAVITLKQFIEQTEVIAQMLGKHLQIDPEGFPLSVAVSNASLGQTVTSDGWSRVRAKTPLQFLPYRLKEVVRKKFYSHTLRRKEALSEDSKFRILQALGDDVGKLERWFDHMEPPLKTELQGLP